LEAIEHHIVLFLQNLIQTIGWAGIVVAMAVESACVPLPLLGWLVGCCRMYHWFSVHLLDWCQRRASVAGEIRQVCACPQA